MAYERVNWENLPSTKTPINQTNLNKMENGIDQAGAEIFVGAEEPTTGEKVWFNKNKNSIYVRNSNGVYEEFIKKEDIKKISFTKNDANNIYYYSMYATENEVQINADVRYSFSDGTYLKAFTIEKQYSPLIFSESEGQLKFPVTTDYQTVGYAIIKSNGEVYIHTNGQSKAAIINIRYRYK